MKGNIRKYIDSDYDGETRYRIEYQRGDMRMPSWLDIDEKEMAEFMDDINKCWDKILTDKLNKTLKSYKEEK